MVKRVEIPKNILMGALAQRITDTRVVTLVRRYLEGPASWLRAS